MWIYVNFEYDYRNAAKKYTGFKLKLILYKIIYFNAAEYKHKS